MTSYVPGHRQYAQFTESARRHLIRYGIDCDEAINLSDTLTRSGFLLPAGSTIFKRFIDDLGLIAQTLQLRERTNQAVLRIYQVDGPDLEKESIVIGFTPGSAVTAALKQAEKQRIAALRDKMRCDQPSHGKRQELPSAG